MIKFDDFVSLLVLASCGGERTKLGIGNFKQLMEHMGIKQVEIPMDSFDSGRDDSESQLQIVIEVEKVISEVESVVVVELEDE